MILRRPITDVAALLIGTILIIAGVFFDFYAFRGAPSDHSLMNAEGIVTLAFLIILGLRAKRAETLSTYPKRNFAKLSPTFVAVVILGVIALAFLGGVRNPFVYDDYTHITDAAQYTWRSALQQFGRAIYRPGLFFRPVGFLLYWVNYLWAGASPVPWHASSMAFHAASSCLTYALCREIGLSRAAGLGAALLFAINGAAAETVAWIDARFDLMTTFLVLLSVTLICRYIKTTRWAWLTAALAGAVGAMLSKESAFCLPLLICCLALFRRKEDRGRVWVASMWAGGFAAVLFLYRWWAMGGIGGYRSPAGVPQIVQFNILHTLNALLLREWAILFFPVNWSLSPGLALRIAVAAIPLILAACALAANVFSRRFLGCLAFAMAASLPVQHLLLIGSDLNGARNLYMASVGWAMLWGVALDGMNWKLGAFAACLMLLLHSLMLEHNLKAWHSAAQLAQSVCTEFGRTVARTPGIIVVRGLPATRNGAVFLHNGFRQCVEMNSGVSAARVQVQALGDESRPAGDFREFVWSETRDRIEESRPQ